MQSTGMVRDIDKVGRVVIPKEIRDNFNIHEKDPLEIFIKDDMIILKKYEPACLFCGNAEDIVSYNDRKICREWLKKLCEL